MSLDTLAGGDRDGEPSRCPRGFGLAKTPKERGARYDGKEGGGEPWKGSARVRVACLVRLLRQLDELDPRVPDISEASRPISLEATAHEPLDGRRRFPLERGPVDSSAYYHGEDVADGLAVEHLPARQRFVEAAAKRPDIRSLVDLLSFRLLRRSYTQPFP